MDHHVLAQLTLYYTPQGEGAFLIEQEHSLIPEEVDTLVSPGDAEKIRGILSTFHTAYKLSKEIMED